MSFLRNRLLRRFTPLARLSDLALVAGMGFRLAKRMGWISSDGLGLSDGDEASSTGLSEIVLAGFAAYRLVRRRYGRR